MELPSSESMVMKLNTITIDEGRVTHFTMKNGDEIFVNSIQGIARNQVHIHSSVGVSGDYQFTNGERVYDMLLKSNSLNDNLFLNSAYLVRAVKILIRSISLLTLLKWLLTRHRLLIF